MNTQEFVLGIKAFPTRSERRKFYIDDVVAHYNSNNRALQEMSTFRCQYSPTPTSDGCAIGRRLSEETLALIAPANMAVVARGVFIKLPTWMQQLGQDFLSAVQSLHDQGSYWDENGITESGKKYAESINLIDPA